MDSDKVFRIESSNDGKTWTFDPRDDDANYPWLARKAKDRSTTSNKYERIVRIDMGNKQIVAFYKGTTVTLKNQASTQ